MALGLSWQQVNSGVARIIAQCWTDTDYKQRLLENPKAVVEQEFNTQFSPEIEVRVELYSHRWRIEPSPEMSGAVFTVPLPHRPAGYTDQEVLDFANEVGEARVDLSGCLC